MKKLILALLACLIVTPAIAQTIRPNSGCVTGASCSASTLSLGGATISGGNILAVAGSAGITGNLSVTGILSGKGQTNGTTPAAGYIGEEIKACLTQGQEVSIPAGVWSVINTMSLTPGNYQIWGMMWFQSTGSSSSNDFLSAINTLTARPTTGSEGYAFIFQNSQTYVQVIPEYFVNITSTTTYNFQAMSDFTGGVMDAFGCMYALRLP